MKKRREFCHPHQGINNNSKNWMMDLLEIV
jgi:hypothetical protein